MLRMKVAMDTDSASAASAASTASACGLSRAEMPPQPHAGSFSAARLDTALWKAHSYSSYRTSSLCPGSHREQVSPRLRECRALFLAHPCRDFCEEEERGFLHISYGSMRSTVESLLLDARPSLTVTAFWSRATRHF